MHSFVSFVNCDLFLIDYMYRCVQLLYVDGGSGRLLGEELPALAKEVARVEAVRTYAGEYVCIFIHPFPFFIA